jgi:two-component system, chemotaxis family, CheB/CheR fusion protein
MPDLTAAITIVRGEYSPASVQRIRSEWREKYFHGKGVSRVNREVRRLVIFGRSNLCQDAPISHVNLLICCNLLIYFDSDLQKQILKRLHYALEPGGVLFLRTPRSRKDAISFQEFSICGFCCLRHTPLPRTRLQ